jgi:hypothetical protein
MHNVKQAILLLEAKPAGLVGSVRWLIYSCCYLLLKQINGIIEDACRNQKVPMDPRAVQDSGDLHRWEIVISKLAAFSFGPGKHILIESEDVLGKLLLLWPKELIMVEIKVIEAFLCKAGVWHEQGWVGQEWWQWEQWVFRSTLDDAKVFREGGSYRVNLLGSLLVAQDFCIRGHAQGIHDILLECSHARWGRLGLKG